jgi:copper transport protein
VRRSLPVFFLLAVLLGGWLVAGVATATPAAAHAELVSTEPGEGARLDRAPDRITLRFTEPVSLGSGYARLLHADGTVQESDASVDGGTLTLTPRSELPDDLGYLVTYRVISADSHPIAGAFSFTVGDAELVQAGSADGNGNTDRVVAVALPVFRWLGFAGLALGVGVPVVLACCWPSGRPSGRVRRVASAGLGAVALSAVGTFALQGPYGAGEGLGAALDPDLLSATASSATGWTLLARAVLAAGLALVLRPIWRRDTPPSVAHTALAGVLALAVVVTTAAIGHPVAGPWPGLAVAVAVIHAAAMAVWLGGLAALLAVVLRPAAEPVPATTDLPGLLTAWSRLAFGSVAALVVTGTVQAVREVESPTALFVTAYGWILLAKLALVVVLLGAAGVSRVWVQQRLGLRRSPAPRRRGVTVHAFAASSSDAVAEPASDARSARQAEHAVEHLPSLRRSVLVEFAVAAAVLALSAVLVGTPPARSAVAQPVDVLLPLQTSAGPSGSVQLSVDPARPGPNTLHVYLFDDDGRPTQPAQITVRLTERVQELGPLDVELEPAGPGHYVGNGMAIPGAGTWTLSVSVRLDEFTATTAGTDFPVR